MGYFDAFFFNENTKKGHFSMKTAETIVFKSDGKGRKSSPIDSTAY